MTDRELLELAAKAAGIDAYWSVDGSIQARPTFVISAGGGMGTMPYEEQWNPLHFDSDAFRLAVKLRICTLFPMDGDHIKKCGAGLVGCDHVASMEPFYPDPAAALRRAIVRAAAEIGRAMA